MRSATSRTSRSLCVMNTIEVPDSLSWRMMPISSSVSCGVSTAVGSSKTSTRASRESALMISTRCCDADRQVFDERVGVDVEPESGRDLADALARGVQIEDAAGLGGLVAQHDVLGDGEDRDEHEVLVHHADAGAHRVAGTLEVLHDIVEQDHAVVGAVEPVEDVHQRRLAGAVLTEETVDLSRLDDEVDVVVRDEGAEPLGDPAEFELHAPDPSEWARSGARGYGNGEAGRPASPSRCGTSPRGRTRRGSIRR